MVITIVALLNCFFEGSKPLEGAKKLVLFKEVRSCTTKVRNSVRVQFLKALGALRNSGALKMSAPFILVLKSFCSVMIVFFIFFFLYEALTV